MNRIQTELSIPLMAAQTTVAVLAALGTLTLLPASLGGDLSRIIVPLLTVAVAAGLIMGSHREVVRAREDTIRKAATDPLTGLATPAAGERVLSLEFAAAQRGRPLAIVLLRIEDYPRYAARHGGVVANQLLRRAGRTLRQQQRQMHLTAHHGHDRGTFLSILSGMDLDGACVYGKRLRHALMTLPGLPDVPPVSMGIAAFDLSMTSPKSLLRQVERALERGAAAGGKVVVIGQPGQGEAEAEVA